MRAACLPGTVAAGTTDAAVEILRTLASVLIVSWMSTLAEWVTCRFGPNRGSMSAQGEHVSAGTPEQEA